MCGAIVDPVPPGSVTPFGWVVFANKSAPAVARSAVSYKFATLGKFFAGLSDGLVAGMFMAATWAGHDSCACHRLALIF